MSSSMEWSDHSFSEATKLILILCYKSQECLHSNGILSKKTLVVFIILIILVVILIFISLF